MINSFNSDRMRQRSFPLLRQLAAFISVFWLLFVGNVFASFNTLALPTTTREVPGVVLVKLTDESSATINRIASISGVSNISSAITRHHASEDAIPLSKWRKIITTNGAEASVVAELRTLVAVENAYRMRHFVVHHVPDPDSLTSDQWGLAAVRAFQAWEVTSGVPSVVVGVIDTGCDIFHPDLAPILWNNPGEAGALRDSNQVDDDSNGYVDDAHGWNFVDNNNNLADVYGHGTLISGVAVAAANQVGVIGLAPNASLMTLRAGDANGFLSEDDVASALIYAADNGADIVNMSFGDEVVAPLLRDAIEYARSKNVVLVASAGNSSDNRINYPAGYETVISVGASTRDGYRASFSTYNSALDLIAPGDSILTASRNLQWTYASGTSLAAPFVSAAAALLLSRDSTLNPSEIQNILCVSADPPPAGNGWDLEYGHGTLNADRALRTPRQAEVRILSPLDGASIADTICPVVGTVSGPRLLSWSLYYGVGSDPSRWVAVRVASVRQKVQEVLDTIRIAASDSIITIRLVVEVGDGNPYESRVIIRHDATAPVIKRKMITPALVNGRWGWRVEVATDDQTRCTFQWTRNGVTVSRPFPYIDTKNALTFTTSDNLVAGDVARIIAINNSGIQSISSPFTIPSLPVSNPSLPLVELPNIHLPNGYLMPQQMNWRGDGRPEVLLNIYSEMNTFDSLWLMKLYDSTFVRVRYYGTAIPQNALDVNRDSIPELMLFAGGTTGIHVAARNDYPRPDSLLVPIEANGAYGAGLFVFDPNDEATGNFIIRNDRKYAQSRYEVWSVWRRVNNTFSAETTATIVNPSRGINIVGRPRFRVGKILGSNSCVGVWGDADGDLMLTRRQDTHWITFKWDSLGDGNATDYFAVGDVDGDGTDEFVGGYETATKVQTERDFPFRKWVFYLYRWMSSSGTEPSRMARLDSLTIDGALNPSRFNSGVEMGDLDGDGKKEIFISASPYLLVMKVDSTRHWRIVYQAMNARSNTVALFDVNNNHRPELVYNDGTQFRFLEYTGSTTSQPLTPSGLIAQPLDTNRISVSWNAVSNAQSYWLIKTHGDDPVDTIPSLVGTTYLDTNVYESTEPFKYRVAAYSSTFAQPLGVFSSDAPALAHIPPHLISANYSDPDRVRLVFSRSIHDDALIPNRFRLKPSTYPVSVISSREGVELLLRFDPKPPTGTYTLKLENIYDRDMSPLAGVDSVQLYFPPAPPKQFFMNSAMIQNGCIVVTFSLPYVDTTITSAAFRIVANREQTRDTLTKWNVIIARVEQVDSVTVRLIPAAATPIGRIGILYDVTALSTIRSRNGQFLNSNYNSISISTQPTTLESLFIYPNPARLDRNERIVIAGLPQDAKVMIYSTSGFSVKRLISEGASGSVIWDGTNEQGAEVASGIYFVVAEKNGSIQKGKVAILR